MSRVRLAAGRIPCVTVEIPAIPEDARQVAAMLAALRDAGVNFLNLHQLRLTPHNLANFKQRRYTYLHGDKVTVLESELAALEIMRSAVADGIDLPINYCSYVYKHRFQRAAARRNSARFIAKSHESITANGYIRTLYVIGDPLRITALAERLAAWSADGRLWSLSQSKERLFFHASLWPLMDFADVDVHVGYAEALLCPHITYRRAFTKVPLNPRRTLVVERQPVSPELNVDATVRSHFVEHFLQSDLPATDLPASVLDAFAPYERVQAGLQSYF